MSNKETKATEKKAPEAKKNDVKTQASNAKEARPAAAAAQPVAEKAAVPEVPKTIEVPTYRLAPDVDPEKFKGQRKLMVLAFKKAGKAVAAIQLAPFFDDITLLTKQNPQAVIDYHCLKMQDDGLLIEDSKITVEAPRRQRKPKPEGADTSSQTAAETAAEAK
jgi:hypothetical protein